MKLKTIKKKVDKWIKEIDDAFDNGLIAGRSEVPFAQGQYNVLLAIKEMLDKVKE